MISLPPISQVVSPYGVNEGKKERVGLTRKMSNSYNKQLYGKIENALKESNKKRDDFDAKSSITK
jgi:hypothetical protein